MRKFKEGDIIYHIKTNKSFSMFHINFSNSALGIAIGYPFDNRYYNVDDWNNYKLLKELRKLKLKKINENR